MALKVTQTDPPAQQRWQIQVREPKQLLPGLFALLPALLFRADQGDRANQGRNNLQPLTFQTGGPFFTVEKRKLKRVHKSRASESTALGSDVCAAGMTAQGLGWDFPPQWLCFAFFFQLQPWQREGLTGSFLRENLEMEGHNR